jgi:hypothetical protein
MRTNRTGKVVFVGVRQWPDAAGKISEEHLQVVAE